MYLFEYINRPESGTWVPRYEIIHAFNANEALIQFYESRDSVHSIDLDQFAKIIRYFSVEEGVRLFNSIQITYEIHKIYSISQEIYNSNKENEK